MKIYHGRRDCVGEPCGIAEVDPVGRTHPAKEERQPFIPGDFCGESRYQCQHSEPDRGRAGEVLDTDADELLGRRVKAEENDPVETTAARIRRLKPKEQKIVIQTMKALMDGMEGKDGWEVPQI